MMKNTEKQKGITLVALIITIIVMIILVAVTLNIALGENGLIGKTKAARMKQEEQSILEEIIALATWDKNGNIETNETYERVKSNFTTEEVSKTSSEIKFKVQGKYGKYGYKISKTEITLDNTEVVAGEDYYFTFNQIKNYLEDFLANYNATVSDDEKMTSEQMWKMLIQTGNFLDDKQPHNATGLLGEGIPFWDGIVNKSFVGQYGVNTAGILRSESNDFEYSDFSSEEAFTKESKYIITFIPEGQQYVQLIIAKSGRDLGLVFTYDGNDENGNDETNSIMSWQEFLNIYGDTKFYFDGSKNKKESYAIKIYGNNLASYDDAIAYKGENFEYTFVANEGYILPKTIEVTNQNRTLEQGKDYTWDSETGKFSIEKVTESLHINVDAKSTTANIYITYNTNYSNYWSETAKIGDEYKYTISQDENYIFPQTIEIYIGWSDDEKLIEGTDYTWDSTNGTITIFNIQDNLRIFVKGLRGSEQIRTNLMNCSKENENDSSVTVGSTYSNKIIANDGYILPKQIRVEDYFSSKLLQEGIDYTWNNETGDIQIFNVNALFEIYIEARKSDIKYVSYDNKLWAVLYEENELGEGQNTQIINVDTLDSWNISSVTVDDNLVTDINGDGDLKLEKAIYIGDNIISILNDTCANLVKNTRGITKTVRSYGTNPTNSGEDTGMLKDSTDSIPNWYLDTYGSYGRQRNIWSYEQDIEKTRELGITINKNDYIGGERIAQVWVRTRDVNISDTEISTTIQIWSTAGGSASGLWIWTINSDGTYQEQYGTDFVGLIRPIIILEKGALDNALGGTGTIDDPIRLD